MTIARSAQSAPQNFVRSAGFAHEKLGAEHISCSHMRSRIGQDGNAFTVSVALAREMNRGFHPPALTVLTFHRHCISLTKGYYAPGWRMLTFPAVFPGG